MDESRLIAELLGVRTVQPGRCAADVWERGESVLVFAGPRSWMVERWVQEVARRSELRVDWSMFAGYCAVKALLPDRESAERLARTINSLWPALQTAADREQARAQGGYPVQLHSYPLCVRLALGQWAPSA